MKVDSGKFQGPPLPTDPEVLEKAKHISLEKPEGLPGRAELMVALDVDGTITRSDGNIAEATKIQVQALVADGTKVTIATGRSAESVAPILAELGLKDVYLACANGAVLMHAYDDPEAVAESAELMAKAAENAKHGVEGAWRLPAHWRTNPGLNGTYSPLNGQSRVDDQGRELVFVQNSKLCFEIIKRHTFDPAEAIDRVSRALPNAVIGSETVDCGFLASGDFPHGELLEANAVVDIEEMKKHPTARVVVRDPNMAVAEFAAIVDGAGLEQWETAVGWTAWLDIGGKGVTKAVGLEELRCELGVARAGCVAAGDGLNDLEMMEWASRKPHPEWGAPGGWAIAMGNGHPQIKALSDVVTAHTDADGLALALAVL